MSVGLFPKLRFSGHSEDWSIVSVGDLVANGIVESPKDGNHGNIHPKASDYVDFGIPFVMSNNIVDGVLNFSSMKYISKKQADTLQKGFSKTGDVLLTHKGTIGESALVEKSDFPYLMLTPQVTYYRVKKTTALLPNYLLQVFRSPKFLSVMQCYSSSGTRPYIGITEQKELLIPFPMKSEQQKIANFLSAVDQKINQLKQKRVLLQEYKKGVMQQLFSRKIRFKDDNGQDFPEWEEKTLGELISLKLREVEKPKENYLAIGIRSHMKGTFHKPDSDPEAIAMDKLYVVRTNDLVVNITFAWEGAIAIATPQDEGGLVSHRFPTYTFKKGQTDHKYFKHIISLPRFKYLLDLISPGGAGRNRVLSKKEFLKLKWFMPSIEEQRKISDCLDSFDRKIEIITGQIEQAENFKKGLLQQMFV